MPAGWCVSLGPSPMGAEAPPRAAVCARDWSMVLAFAFHLLGISALLLATVPGARGAQCSFPHIQHGRRVSIARYFYRTGDTVRFTCNTGYTLHGSHTSMCGADSRWIPPLPQCKKGKCPSAVELWGKLPLVSSQTQWESKAGMYLFPSLVCSNQSAAGWLWRGRNSSEERRWGGTWGWQRNPDTTQAFLVAHRKAKS
ncbi:uncharacterized protein ACIB01_017166 isoform 2-T2 [Guaruba guarouba]